MPQPVLRLVLLDEAALAAACAAGYVLLMDAPLEAAPKERAVLSPVPDRIPLSPREREVVALISQGLSNETIATRLGVARRTVVAHLEHIFRKLGLHSRTQLARWAMEHDRSIL